MARVSFKNDSAYYLRLQKLEHTAAGEELLEEAVAAGAGVVADEIRNRLAKLPEDEFRLLDVDSGEMFVGLPEGQKRDLLDSFGLAPISRDRNGFVNSKAGFDGYGSFPTRAYPDGVPNQLLARAVESGSSVRAKTPFVRPAVNATRKEAVAAMEKVIDDGLKNIFEK